MALATFIAGAYTHTYNAVGTGITREGFMLSQTTKQELIDETDAYGNTLIDWVWRGGDVDLEYATKTYADADIAPYWPWAAFGTLLTAAAPIGRLASAVAAASVLTSTANTPAAAAPATLTGALAILAPGFNGKLLFNSKVREVPVRLQFLPSASGGTVTHFSTT